MKSAGTRYSRLMTNEKSAMLKSSGFSSVQIDFMFLSPPVCGARRLRALPRSLLLLPIRRSRSWPPPPRRWPLKVPISVSSAADVSPPPAWTHCQSEKLLPLVSLMTSNASSPLAAVMANSLLNAADTAAALPRFAVVTPSPPTPVKQQRLDVAVALPDRDIHRAAGPVPRREQEVVVVVAVVPGRVERPAELDAVVARRGRAVGVEVADHVAELVGRAEPEDVLHVVVRRARVEDVGADAADEDVASGPAVDGVDAGAADERVGAGVARQRVVARAAGHVQDAGDRGEARRRAPRPPG